MRAAPPEFMFLQTNQRCNLRCTHCEYWKLDDDNRKNYLSTERRCELIAEFAELGGKAIVTCGGEPMLDLEDYFAVIAAARSHGLRFLSVVNGTRIQNQAIAAHMIALGPTEITISLDHWQPEENDRLRGVKNAHRMAVRALRLLLEERAQSTVAHPPIYAMTILSEDTWPTLERFYEFALLNVGVDKLKLNIMQPTFQGESGGDSYFEHARVRDVDACLAKVRECDQRFGIRRNPLWLDNVAMHLRSVNACESRLQGWSNAGTTEAICNSYDRNIMIDLYGVARLCFSTTYPGAQLVEPGDLRAFWHDVSLPIRERMIGCKQFCGISHSVRKEPSLLRLGGAR